MALPPPTILSCAVTGNLTTPEQNPDLPVTPEEIALSAIEAARAGAAIVHLHVRDPETGAPSMDLGYYRTVVELIRQSDVDPIINLTTGQGGRFVPGEPDPTVAGPGTSLTTAAARVAHVEALKPEICTLDFNTMWSGSAAVINSPKSLEEMAARIRAAGVKPELEVFDSGDIHHATSMIAAGKIEGDPLFQIVTGVRWGAASTTETMAYLKSLLPATAQWAGFGIGRMAYPMLAQAYLLGGHIRIGMEDTVYIGRGELAPSNAALVTKALGLLDTLGGRPATPSEARAILGLAPRSH